MILVHNYQLPEVQDIADYRGDSLELSRIAAKSDARVIIFCGVHFMAETASILCPDKKVLIPDLLSGCPMASMITASDLRELKNRHPKAVVVGYVNTSAEVKAELDICCTSTNAVEVENSLKKEDEIIYVPDKYLADFVSKKTGRVLINWDGYCPTHVKIRPEDIIKQIRLHPHAKVIVHPECIPEVIALADIALSTGRMCKFAKESDAKEFIIGTETGIIYRLHKDNPGKKFYPACELAVCPNMKRTTLEKVLWSLEELKEEVRVADSIRQKAKKAIERMLAIK
ncbi:MAG: quinolinate synthase NadA [Candidatus Omnitrophota bacterium]|nr:quinolinate synthase NadA [Candidatus Omnitrophota bacterium]